MVGIQGSGTTTENTHIEQLNPPKGSYNDTKNMRTPTEFDFIVN